jgi:GT2 family glycosyltransferase
MHPLPNDTTRPTLAVIILNWNAATDTLACLAHVAQWQCVTPRVWVVDNASHPTDRRALREGLAKLPLDWSLIENESNLGFAGGTNCGLRATLAAGDWPVLLLNNDARIDDANLQQLMTTLSTRAQAGWVGPLLYHGDKLHSVGRRNPVLHHNTLITALPSIPILIVGFISGSVALARAAMLREVGLLDEDYFFNTEVADHCHRARQAGYQTVVDSCARAQHDLDRSSALRSTLYIYYIIRNRFVYIRKRYHLAVWPLTALWMLYCFLLVGKLRGAGQRATAQAVYLGLVDGISKRWGGQNSRVLAACGQNASQGAAPDRTQSAPQTRP